MDRRRKVELFEEIRRECRLARCCAARTYSSHLTNWRREEGAFASRRARKRGPTPQPNRFALETARSRERLSPAEVAAGRHGHHAPKKVAEVLGIPPKERPPAQP